jgi:hypothetical protein
LLSRVNRPIINYDMSPVESQFLKTLEEYVSALTEAIDKLADICCKLGLKANKLLTYDRSEYYNDVNNYNEAVNQYMTIGKSLNKLFVKVDNFFLKEHSLKVREGRIPEHIASNGFRDSAISESIADLEKKPLKQLLIGIENGMNTALDMGIQYLDIGYSMEGTDAVDGVLYIPMYNNNVFKIKFVTIAKQNHNFFEFSSDSELIKFPIYFKTAIDIIANNNKERISEITYMGNHVHLSLRGLLEEENPICDICGEEVAFSEGNWIETEEGFFHFECHYHGEAIPAKNRPDSNLFHQKHLPTTLEHAVDHLISSLSTEYKKKIREMSLEELEMTHFLMGIAIRNQLKLGMGNDELLQDCGPNIHP